MTDILDRLRAEIERLAFLHNLDHSLADQRTQKIDELTAQIERLTADFEGMRKSRDHHASTIFIQSVQIERYRVDAERYRWLRRRIIPRIEEAMDGSKRLAITTRLGFAFFDTEPLATSIDVSKNDALDAAIDAAIREKE